MFIQDLKYDNAKDFLNSLLNWNNDLSNYIFRGHSREEYTLLPNSLRKENLELLFEMANVTAFRTKSQDTESAIMEYEHSILRSFYKSSDMSGLVVPTSNELRNDLVQEWGSILNFPTSHPFIEWLPESAWEVAALAQHYGLPTRLLDWTYDPFVAAYFASRPSISSDIDGNMIIWGLNKEAIGIIKMLSLDGLPLNFVTPHYSTNSNINAQKGLFTHFSTKINYSNPVIQGRKPLDIVLKDCIDAKWYKTRNIFVRVSLPNKIACEVFSLLNNFGYNSSRLFPGYGGVVKHMNDLVKCKNQLHLKQA